MGPSSSSLAVGPYSSSSGSKIVRLPSKKNMTTTNGLADRLFGSPTLVQLAPTEQQSEVSKVNSIYYSNEINRLIDIISIYTADQQMEWPSRPSVQQVSNSGQTTETRPARTQETVPSSEFAILFDPVAWRHLASLCRPSE